MILDQEHQTAYNANGYFIVNEMVDFFVCEDLNNRLSQLDSKMSANFFTSGYSPDVNYKSVIDKLISETITPSIYEKYVESVELFYANFLSKSKGEYSECVMHNDWSITDETIYDPLHLWIPLIDTTIQNGTLAFVKGSHKLTAIYRGFNTKHYYNLYYDALKNNHITYMEVKAGTGIFYHPGLIHFSPPNETATKRNAILLSFYPKNAQPVIYYKPKWNWNDKINVYELTKDFYTIWDKKSKPITALLRNVKEPRKSTDLNSFIKSL